VERRIFRFEQAVNLVRRAVRKTVAIEPVASQPDLAAGLENAMRADDVGFDERVMSKDGAVDMGFRGDMHDSVDPVRPQCRFDERVIGNIAVQPAVEDDILARGNCVRTDAYTDAFYNRSPHHNQKGGISAD
jgi:hypothetical protein